MSGKDIEDVSAGLDRLEEIVEKLEEETVDLEDSIELFKEGVQLGDEIQAYLAEAREELYRVVEESDGDYSLEDFEL